MAGLLAITRPGHLPLLQPLPGPGQGLLLFHKAPGGGTRPFLAHHVAMGLFLHILKYWADLLASNHRTTQSMNSFWYQVCR